MKRCLRRIFQVQMFFSNHPKDSKFFEPTNKKVIGKMKDEKEAKINDEFVGLKSKMYSIKNIDGK